MCRLCVYTFSYNVTIFNIGYGGVQRPPLPTMGYWLGKSREDDRVNKNIVLLICTIKQINDIFKKSKKLFVLSMDIQREREIESSFRNMAED